MSREYNRSDQLDVLLAGESCPAARWARPCLSNGRKNWWAEFFKVADKKISRVRSNRLLLHGPCIRYTCSIARTDEKEVEQKKVEEEAEGAQASHAHYQHDPAALRHEADVSRVFQGISAGWRDQTGVTENGMGFAASTLEGDAKSDHEGIAKAREEDRASIT